MGKKGKGTYQQKRESFDTQISKRLTYLLRHNAQGINISPDGWCKLQDIVQQEIFRDTNENHIKTIIQNDKKMRFQVKNEQGIEYIRATQGHSMEIVQEEGLLKPITIADVQLHQIQAIHGTIKTIGLSKMSRKHIHMAPGMPRENQVISGMRQDCEVYIYVDILKCLLDGLSFYRSENNVILCPDIILPKYFQKVFIKKNQIDLSPVDIDFYFVIDFEANCCQDNSQAFNEIIEFPVQVIDAKTLQKLDVFHEYVKPTVYSKVTPFCTELTGITQQMVQDRKTLSEVLDIFHNFVVQRYPNPMKWVFASCGDWDLQKCLVKETQFKNMKTRAYMQRYINIKKIFPHSKYIENLDPNQGLGDMMEMLAWLKLPHEGRHHSGIDDVCNISNILIQLLRDGCNVIKNDINYIGDFNPGQNKEVYYQQKLQIEMKNYEEVKQNIVQNPVVQNQVQYQYIVSLTLDIFEPINQIIAIHLNVYDAKQQRTVNIDYHKNIKTSQEDYEQDIVKQLGISLKNYQEKSFLGAEALDGFAEILVKKQMIDSKFLFVSDNEQCIPHLLNQIKFQSPNFEIPACFNFYIVLPQLFEESIGINSNNLEELLQQVGFIEDRKKEESVGRYKSRKLINLMEYYFKIGLEIKPESIKLFKLI